MLLRHVEEEVLQVTDKSELALVYVEAETRRRLSFRGGEVQPLRLDEFLALKGDLRANIEFPLRIRNAIVEASEFEDIKPQDRRSVSAHLQSTFGSNVVALVNGGWLPSGVVLDEEILLLPDRCTVGAIRSRFIGGVRKYEQNDDFLDFAQGQRLRINPMLYAMEGSSGRHHPSAAELSSLFDRAAQMILQALPMATIFPDKADVMQGALAMLEDAAKSFAARQRFLVKAAPLIAAPVPQARLRQVWDQLLDLCDHYRVPRASLLVCALISASAARQGQNPALALLKPRAHYTDKNAFNALADLRALDLLIGASTDFSERRVALLTEDRALAQYWAGLQAHSFRREGAHIHYDINPHRALFGRLSEAEQSEVLRVLADS